MIISKYWSKDQEREAQIHYDEDFGGHSVDFFDNGQWMGMTCIPLNYEKAEEMAEEFVADEVD